MMHHMAPGILHVLMPHWPQVALRLEAMHSQSGASKTEFDAGLIRYMNKEYPLVI